MDVLMPQLGETVAEGKIVKWFKTAGDAVKPGENLFEIETDKTSMEVPATFAGTLTDIRFQVGEVAKVGAVVAVIAGAGGAAQLRRASPGVRCSRRQQSPLTPAKAGVQTQTANPHWVPARAGMNGRAAPSPIRTWTRSARCALRTATSARRASAAPQSRRWRAVSPASAASILPVSKAPGRTAASSPPTSRRAPARAALWPAARARRRSRRCSKASLTRRCRSIRMRRTIAARLVEAKQTIPHFYLIADIEVGRLAAMREEANAAAPKGRRPAAFKLSLNDFIIKAWAAALKRVPAANAVWAEDRILRFPHADIGVAVALDGGLITPVIRNADSKSLTAISADMRDLAARARDRKLKPNEYQGGASAISNLGMYGVREFSAIINPPHATILAVGAARRAPVEAPDGG